MGRIRDEKIVTKTPKARQRKSSDDFSMERITQSRGLTYKGEMRLIADYTTDSDGVKSAWQELEIWETRSGKWIAVIMGKYDNNSRHHEEFTKATLFEDVRPDDLGFQCAVAAALDWTKAARVMLREQLGWKLLMDVD